VYHHEEDRFILFPGEEEYTLTKSGLELVDVIRGIRMWALKWKIENIPCGCQDCNVCGLLQPPM